MITKVDASSEILPNRGSSKPDSEAIGPECDEKVAWQRARNIDTSLQVKLVKISHMRYQHPDLDILTTFLTDFGMHVTKRSQNEAWFHGYGPDHYVYYARKGEKKFLGGAFEVESYQDLERILDIPDVRTLEGGIRAMSEAPGQGSILTIEDPEGFPVNFVFGQSTIDQARIEEASRTRSNTLVLNYETEKSRQRAFQRFEPGPAEVYKLGHFGLVTAKFEVLKDWYTRYFNIVPSDLLYVTEGDDLKRREVAMFAHIDRGLDLVDHHTLFLSTAPPGKKPHPHHCSFEVHDFDTQALGHQWLAAKNYKSVWGIGRHILGSQIFDYWWDVTGNMVEHYADGDVVNKETPLAYAPAGNEGLAVWGPEVPPTFLE
ncbi:trihydroxytoluene oxygenase [Paraphoma chrysanthemicola]|uniref:Trihydroxytoluene oxygenase n=1 Tax=Paraphoma chrysanthemicola TaxID=798071 RepID=A0A8K0VTQ7_9PLEO|nr:trihydroxytoluene oxygenase [Paraphoma chrysanthemicola]